MSPLARPLLALATAALFAAALAEDEPIRRRMFSGNGGTPAACAELTMGATPDIDPFIVKIELERLHINPPKNSTHKFNINLPNKARYTEALVGQRVLVCDFKNANNLLDVKAIKVDQHSPLTVTCKNGCPAGIEVIADQFIIHPLRAGKLDL